ncbi:MAG: type III pantothenate kinase [Thermodesulfobacteriota bacterium]
MLLVIDIGNTNTVIGIYEGRKLIRNWRIRTERNTTEDELCVLLNSLFSASGIRFQDLDRTVISCVVPPVVRHYDAFCRKYLSRQPHWVDAASTAGMPILYTNPAEVGADRIVNAVAAYEQYRTSLIIIDFGTATTFDVISEKGEYIGGAITPGIMISSEALFMNASKLPRVDLLTPPAAVIGRDTAGSIKSGIIYGYAGLVDGMVKRIAKEMGGVPKVIATGGLAGLIHKVSETIEIVDPDLTLEGLRIISERIQGLHKA